MDIEERIKTNIEALERLEKTGCFYHSHPKIENTYLDSKTYSLLTILKAQLEILEKLKDR